MRARFDIGYDGAAFHGWATQPGYRTVQQTIEEWIATIYRLPERPELVCAGRTDAGVHARGQVAHCDLPEGLEVDDLARRLAKVLPRDVIVRSVVPALPGFHARFSAVWRRYTYRLSTRPVEPVLRGMVVNVRKKLDIDAMNACAPHLLGLRDFTAFCRRRDGATTIRTLKRLHATMGTGDWENVMEIDVRADAFCHSMVRSLVGAMVAVGSGRHDLDWLATALATPARASDSMVMPAKGLVLEEVGYPSDDQLAARAIESRRRRDEEEL